MNGFKRLKIEYDGIYGTLEEYTNDSNIMNYMLKLKDSIGTGDYETISYSLDEIIKWYDKNIHEIATNNFVYNFDSHKKNLELLKEIKNDLKHEDCTPSNSNHNSTQKEEKIIFLSHKSDDKKYGDALRNFITGLGVKNNQLIYSSHQLHKIPLDKNIYEYLRNNIHSNVFVIILWSDKYLESPACLNEMGAAWVTQSDYTNIYVPDFSFGNPKYHECAVDTRKMGAVLNGDDHCRTAMIELKEKITNMFNLTISEKELDYLLNEFIKSIK